MQDKVDAILAERFEKTGDSMVKLSGHLVKEPGLSFWQVLGLYALSAAGGAMQGVSDGLKQKQRN